jgi:hypothetical protein
MDPSSPSGPAGASGGPGVQPDVHASGLAGATTQSETSSPINAPPDTPIPFSGWTPPSGEIPAAKQVSAISDTLPNSTVPDPAQSIAQNTDIVSTLDSIDAYNQLVANTNTELMTDAGRQQARETASAIADMRPDIIAAQVNPAASMVTVAQLSALRSRVQASIQMIKQLPASQRGTPGRSSGPIEGIATMEPSGGSSELPTPSANGPTGQITLDNLKNLVMRIKAASLALSALASTDVTIVQRKSKLDQMAADIQGMIDNVNNGSLSLADVPIKLADATAFLATVDTTTTPLSPLITPSATAAAATSSSGNATPGNSAATQGLLQSVQKAMASVKFRISYDPASAQRADIMDRLQALEDKLFAYASSDTPISPAMMGFLQQELSILGAMVGMTPNASSYSPTNTLPSMATRMDSSSMNEYPSLAQLEAASGGSVASVASGASQGTGLTDEQIARRGSTASFDESTVGGLDYKTRSVELCRQLQVAYGDTTTFGCIKDPESVSSSYSWRGNYKTICNRIGDVWGGRAGEQYGCPPFNPAAKFSQY